MNLMNERSEETSDVTSINVNVNQISDDISQTTATMTQNQPSHAIKAANIDPIAVLKRVENLRKWQEEEQKKLLKAHEEYMKKIQTEQEMYSKLINNNTSSTSDAAFQSNKSSQSTSTISTAVIETFDLNNKISNLTKDFKQKRMNMIYSVYDDDDDDEEEDNQNEIQNEKDTKQTQSGLNKQEMDHNTNNNDDDIMKEQKLDDDDDDDDDEVDYQEERRDEISNSSASNEDLDDDVIDQMSESELIELIKKQLSKKNFKFQMLNEHDVDVESKTTNPTDQNSLKQNEDEEDREREEFYNSKNLFNFNMNQMSDNYNENDIDEEFVRNHRLSTIIEVSSEENSPLKAMHRNTNRKGNKRVNLSKRIATVSEENETQAADLEQPEEKNEDVKRKEERAVHETTTNHAAINKMVNLDELPIGVKQTNQMSFEQLIEEKLKIADQLDHEQRELSKLAKTKKNKKQQSEQQVDHSSTSTASNFLKKNSSKVTLNMKQQAPPKQLKEPLPVVPLSHPAQIEPQVEFSGHEVETIQTNVSGRAPCKYLKKGEGLKRYQPRAKSTEPNLKLQQQQSSMTNMKSSSNQRITSSSTLRKSNSTSSLLNNNSKKAALKSNNAKRVTTGNNANQPMQQHSSSTQKNVLRKDSSTDRLSSVSLPSSSCAAKANSSSTSNSNQRADKVKEDLLVKQKELEQQQRRIEMLILQQHQEQQRNNARANKFELSDEPESDSVEHDEQANDEIEDDELKEFETLEQYVDEHPSFRSSVSFVENVLSNSSANSQHQQQQQQHQQHRNKLSDLIEEEDIMVNYARSHTAQTRSSSTSSLTRCESASSIKSNSQQQGVVVRKVKRLSETSRRVSSSSPFDYDDSKNCTDTQIYAEANFYSNNNNNNKHHEQATENNEEDDDELNFIGRQQQQQPTQTNHFDDSTSWTNDDEQPIKATIQHRLLKQAHNSNEDKDIDENDDDDDDEQEQKANRTTVTNLMNKLFPSLKEDSSNKKQAVASTKPAMHSDESMPNRAQPTKYEPYTTQQTNVQQDRTDTSQEPTSNILKQKLAQLESEIEKFQKKNVELSKLKEKCEVELKLAETARSKMEKEKQEEMARLRDMHDEEMRKLKLEKKVFEQYKQSLKEQQPDRRERDEIDRLRKQVQELNDELKLKETRWMANNARLKERIDTLEQEKQELKKELQLIEKQRIESLMSVNTHTNHVHHQTQQSNAQSVKAPLSSSSSCSSASSVSSTGLNVYQQLRSNQLQLEAQRLSEESSTMMATQHANNLMLLKRSISEKSLSSSSASSTCSSSSSASIASTGSLALHSNLKYPHYQQPLSSQQEQPQPQQQQQKQQSTHPSPQLPSNISQTVKSVKFKLDNQQMPISSSSADYDEHDSMSSGMSINRVSNVDQSHQHQLQSNEYVNVQGNDRPLRVKETRHFDDKHVEKLLEDGTTLTIFPNGTVKQISADKRLTFVKFFNGDRKEMNHDTGTETYYYAETNITQIIYSNGLQILKFPNGQIEKHHTNKTREIIFPDKVCKFIYPDGSEESRLPNGTYIKVDPNGDKVIEYANKQREIHTKEFKRREYPDGSIKTVYSNGLSETRYASGRVRIKDSQGNIISDKKF